MFADTNLELLFHFCFFIEIQAMIFTKYHRTIIFTLLSLVIFCIFYCSVIDPPFHGYYTTDENFVADSGVLLWYGNTPRGLDWPAAPSMLFYFIAFGISCLLTVIENLGNIHGLISVFECFDHQAYNYLTDREPFILLGRGFQILAVGLILYQTTQIIYRQNHYLLTDAVKFILPVLFITSTLVLDTTPVLRPEALSGNLFILFLARVVFSEKLSTKDIIICSAIFGLILAERLIFAFFLPFYLGAVFLMGNANRFRNILFSLLIIVVSFILFCPFIISDTLVVMKSFVGGIIAKINDKPMGTFFNKEYIGIYFSNPVNILILILAGLGLMNLFKTRKAIYFLLAGNLFLFLFLVLRSSLIYDTHVLPAGVVTLFLVGLGLGFVVERFKGIGFKIALAIVIVIAATNITEAFTYHKGVHRKLNMHDARAWILSLPSETRLLLNPEFEFYVPKSKNCLLREEALNTDEQKMIKKLNYLLGRKAGMGVEGKDLPIIANAFAFEDERQYDAQYKILIKYVSESKNKVYDYDIYYQSVELASHSVQTQEALKNFKDGKYEYMVTETKIPGMEPIKVFDKAWGITFYVYSKPNQQ